MEMTVQDIIRDLRVVRKALKVLTHPIAIAHLGNKGHEDERTKAVTKLEKRMEDLEFAHEMATAMAGPDGEGQ